MQTNIPALFTTSIFLVAIAGCESQPVRESKVSDRSPAPTSKDEATRQAKSNYSGAKNNTLKPTAEIGSVSEKTASAPAPTITAPPKAPPAPPKRSPKKHDTVEKAVKTAKPENKPLPVKAPTTPDKVEKPKQAAIPKLAPAVKEPIEIQNNQPESTTAAIQAAASSQTAQLSTPAPPEPRQTPKPTQVQPSEEAAPTQLAMIEPLPEPAEVQPEPAEVLYNQETLPIDFPGGWTLDIAQDRRDGVTRCLLSSSKIAMFDGYDQSEVKLRVSTEAVSVETKSNLDLTYPGVGLSVDGAEPVPFDANPPTERMAYTTQPVQTTMTSGEELTIALGFWPTWPVTQTQNAALSLGGFKQAYAALQQCSQQQ